jgi:hypothetical protein
MQGIERALIGMSARWREQAISDMSGRPTELRLVGNCGGSLVKGDHE